MWRLLLPRNIEAQRPRPGASHQQRQRQQQQPKGPSPVFDAPDDGERGAHRTTDYLAPTARAQRATRGGAAVAGRGGGESIAERRRWMADVSAVPQRILDRGSAVPLLC
jgi:hypothetical protein